MTVEEDIRVGEDVVVSKFPIGNGRHVKMFASASNLYCPICLPFDSTVLFANLPVKIQQRIGSNGPEAVGRMMTEADYFRIRNDVFKFGNGAEVKLSELPEGTALRRVPTGYQLRAPLVTAVTSTVSRFLPSRHPRSIAAAAPPPSRHAA